MKFLLGIPVYNEEENIYLFFKKLIPSLPLEIKEILVINDGSTDRSGHLLEKIKSRFHDKIQIHLSHRYPNQGYGASMIFLFQYAKRKNFDFLIVMDCDRQHKVEDLRRFIYVNTSIDVVSGSRYLPTSPASGMDPPEDRLKVNQKITERLNRTLGFRLTDAFCGFKRYKMEVIDPDYFTEKGYGFPLEFWSYCYFFRLKIKEIPVTRVYITDDRTFGENLDKTLVRYRYYLQVLKNAKERFSRIFPENEVNYEFQ